MFSQALIVGVFFEVTSQKWPTASRIKKTVGLKKRPGSFCAVLATIMQLIMGLFCRFRVARLSL